MELSQLKVIRNPKEAALSLFFIMNRAGNRPTLLLIDYLDKIPLPVDTSKVHRICNQLFQRVQHSISPASQQLGTVMDTIYPILLHHTRERPCLDKKEVFDRSLQLITLANKYSIGSGCHPRPSAAAAILLVSFCYVYTRTIKPSRRPRKSTSTRYWKFEQFSDSIGCSVQTLRTQHRLLLELLQTCYSQLRFSSEEDAVYTHMEDIMAFYLSQDTTPLELNEDTHHTLIRPRRRANQEREHIQKMIQLAQSTSTATADDTFYPYWRVLQDGYKVEDIRCWSEYRFKEVAASLDFRSTYGTPRPVDLDRIQLDESDISTREMEVYVCK
ncbi:hypothetical protein BDB01DRAFT_286441 [Pilobolus umbonatus]|nr:hypothetical protein BDB01DRAFT_286441 [Pilobolus umbonatus]